MIIIGLVAFAAIKNAIFPPRSAGMIKAEKPVAERPEGPSKLAVMTLAENRLRATMRDPDSAEIRNTYIPQGAAFLCGEVNGTNGFGGKVGYRRFIAGAHSQMPVGIDGENMSSTEFARSWSQLCAR